MRISSPKIPTKLPHTIYKKDYLAILSILIFLISILGYSLIIKNRAQINIITEPNDFVSKKPLLKSIDTLELDQSTIQINYLSNHKATAKLEYGYSPQELYLSQLDEDYQLQGNFKISHSPQIKRIFFRITLTDEAGNIEQSTPLSVINSWL